MAKQHYWEYGFQDKVTRRKYNTGDILENGATCLKCGDYIRSNNKHDYRTCTCGAVAVDGGSWYCRRMGDPGHYVNNIQMYEDHDAPEPEINDENQTFQFRSSKTRGTCGDT